MHPRPTSGRAGADDGRAPAEHARRGEGKAPAPPPDPTQCCQVTAFMSAIAVVGGGYVGLTTAACFARLGHDVVCGELDREKVARLSKGEVPVLEEGLPELVAEGLAARRLTFVVGAATAARSAEFVFLCVQTPPDEQGAAEPLHPRGRRA